MKDLLGLCLAVSLAAVGTAHRHQSSVQRSTTRHQSSAARGFLFFVKEKMRNVGLEITEVKEKINDCCDQADCSYDGRSYTHGSVFTAADNCNLCRCSKGFVACTNSTGCGDQANGESGYNYKDVVAQAYCSSKSTGYIMSAVRRDCDPAAGPAPSCDFICGADSEFRDGVDAYFPEVNLATHCCDGALWLMMDHPILAPNPGPGQTDAGLLNMVTISYDKCDATDCGPNYCCCIACGTE